MIPFSELNFHHEYKKFKTYKQVRNEDDWLQWSRLQEQFGWPLLLDALEAMGPEDRWPNKVETLLCQWRKTIQQERAERAAAEERKKEQEKKRISEQEFQAILKEKGLR